MTQLCYLPIKSLRLVQRTLSTGLKAAYWHTTKQINASITHVGRGMGSPIPSVQEGAWTREGPKVGGEDCEHLRLS